MLRRSYSEPSARVKTQSLGSRVLTRTAALNETDRRSGWVLSGDVALPLRPLHVDHLVAFQRAECSALQVALLGEDSLLQHEVLDHLDRDPLPLEPLDQHVTQRLRRGGRRNEGQLRV